jgi:hypothetical protein
MAASLKSRIDRLERHRGVPGADVLIVKLSRFDAPDDAFSGFRVGGEFFGRDPGESIDDTERRVAELLSHRRDSMIYVLKPVTAHPCKFVEELPE